MRISNIPELTKQIAAPVPLCNAGKVIFFVFFQTKISIEMMIIENIIRENIIDIMFIFMYPHFQNVTLDIIF
ncbi:hypothetical protein BC03BB108_D0080 (plasmid) [Bacillus cereus 03BB108]|nr:hypothetical protein BC03BB108_D0080 [Bacillus cereus 03BB108]